MRRFLVVIEDERSEFDSPAALEAILVAFFQELGLRDAVKRVQPGGLLGMKIMEELPPVRHALMGRPRG